MTKDVYQNVRKNRFTQVGNDMLWDAETSLQAKGLLTIFLSNNEDWELNIKEIIKRSKNGRDAHYKYINELIKRGYFARIEVKDAKGRFERMIYLFSDVKEDVSRATGLAIQELEALGKQPITENQYTVLNKAKPLPENQDTEKQLTENQYINNTNLNNTNLNNTKDIIIIDDQPSAIASVSAIANAINHYKDLKGIKRLNGKVREKLEMQIANFGANGHAIVGEAINIAAGRDALDIPYIEAIIKKWLEADIKSLEDIEAYNTRFKEKRQEKAAAPVKQQGKQTSYNRKQSYTKKPIRTEPEVAWLKEEQEKTAAMAKTSEPAASNGEATPDEKARMEALIAKYKR